MEQRLPAHLEVSGLIRQVESLGGFGMVLQRGERDAGTIMVICAPNGENARAYERMPALDGTRKWSLSKCQDSEKPWEFAEFLDRRKGQDPDMWMVELEIVNGERLIGIDVDS